MNFYAKKRKTPRMNNVCHPKRHTCAQSGVILTNYAVIMAITNSSRLKAMKLHTRAHFCEHFFKRFTIFQVYYFSWQLGHITWHNAKDLYCFDCFRISYAHFKMRPKRWAWPLLGRDRILPNSLWIADEIDSCVPKNDFLKKTWAKYEAPVVQIWPVSS
jgi:hypothetical protein